MKMGNMTDGVLPLSIGTEINTTPKGHSECVCLCKRAYVYVPV